MQNRGTACESLRDTSGASLLSWLHGHELRLCFVGRQGCSLLEQP